MKYSEVDTIFKIWNSNELTPLSRIGNSND
jgi:hypothetical protein